jgi:transcriptional regulator with XRE-family HTH domain
MRDCSQLRSAIDTPGAAGNHPAAGKTRGIDVSESAAIVQVLKRSLKTKGLTYKDIAKRVGLSEASVKRVFAANTFTLQRLESICMAIGISMAELMRLAETHEAGTKFLSLEQEQLLAEDQKLFACFYLLLNGRSSAEIMERLSLNDRELRKFYVALDAAKLIELQPRLKARLRVGPVITWRSEGPLFRVYARRVKEEFLQSEFQGPLEALHFRSAEISEASARILARKLEHLQQDFAELATLDVALPAREKRNVALLVAFRPWVFSMFSGL